jgi:hypothetical protein
VATRLPQVVQVGEQTDIDFLALAQQLVGGKGAALFSAEDMAAIRGRLSEIAARVEGTTWRAPSNASCPPKERSDESRVL